jgi:hypothetical protein
MKQQGWNENRAPDSKLIFRKSKTIKDAKDFRDSKDRKTKERSFLHNL